MHEICEKVKMNYKRSKNSIVARHLPLLKYASVINTTKQDAKQEQKN